MLVHVLDKKKFLEYAINQIKKSSDAAIKAKNVFHIGFSGGETPRLLYSKLVGIDTSWNSWQIWFSDERCLSAGDVNTNSKMVEETLLKHVPIPSSSIHRIRGELGAQEAVKQYQCEIKNVPTFDLALLGLGEDGHTASLFPGNDLGDSSCALDVLAVYDAPKEPVERVSLSINRLNRTQTALFLVAGKKKQKIIDDYSEGVDMPAKKIQGIEQTIVLYCPQNI